MKRDDKKSPDFSNLRIDPALAFWYESPVIDSAPDFKCAAYLQLRKQIVSAQTRQQVANKDKARFTVTWLSLYFNCDFQTLLTNITLGYNKHGAAWTAWNYGFAKQERFDWLPASGGLQKLPAAIFVKGRLKHVPKHLGLQTPVRFRRLRSVPTLKPYPIIDPPQAISTT